MKHIYSHIIKKEYQKPTIEEILVDREMSLVMYSTPPVEPKGVSASEADKTTSKPIYDSGDHKTEAPFGGSKPVYY